MIMGIPTLSFSNAPVQTLYGMSHQTISPHIAMRSECNGVVKNPEVEPYPLSKITSEVDVVLAFNIGICQVPMDEGVHEREMEWVKMQIESFKEAQILSD